MHALSQTETIMKRRQKFELYLQELLLLQPRPVELNSFLAIPQHLYSDAAAADKHAAAAAGSDAKPAGGGGGGEGGPKVGGRRLRDGYFGAGSDEPLAHKRESFDPAATALAGSLGLRIHSRWYSASR